MSITVIILCFRMLFISVKNRGCPKTKGVQKHRVITVREFFCVENNYIMFHLTLLKHGM